MKIYLKDVIRQIREDSGQDKTFALTYHKKDGSYGEKLFCRNRSGHYVGKKKADLSSVKTETKRAGRAYLEYKTDSGRWQPIELYWCLLRTFNGRVIDHRF